MGWTTPADAQTARLYMVRLNRKFLAINNQVEGHRCYYGGFRNEGNQTAGFLFSKCVIQGNLAGRSSPPAVPRENGRRRHSRASPAAFGSGCPGGGDPLFLPGSGLPPRRAPKPSAPETTTQTPGRYNHCCPKCVGLNRKHVGFSTK